MSKVKTAANAQGEVMVSVTNTHDSIKNYTQEKSKPQEKTSRREKSARASHNTVGASIRGDLKAARYNTNLSPGQISWGATTSLTARGGGTLPPGRTPRRGREGKDLGRGGEAEGGKRSSKFSKPSLQSRALPQRGAGPVPANKWPDSMREKKTILGFVICTHGFSLLNARC